MSSPLALASVTAVLRDLLNNGLIDHNIVGAIGSNVTITTVPPDTIPLDSANVRSQLNLFLHHVTPNPAWRNVGLPSRDGSGERLSNPPLALDLHYLLTAYGSQELHSEILLGYAMYLMHERPALDRQAIRTALAGGTIDVSILPPAYQALAAADLADQVEQIRITPSDVTSDEMSKLWSAMQANYRPTVAYSASVVLISAHKPTRSALPVLTRGPRDPVSGREAGISAVPGLLPPYPGITHVLAPAKQLAAVPGDSIVLHGYNLDGDNLVARFSHPLLDAPIELPLGNNANSDRVSVSLPADAAAMAAWPAGNWSVSLELRRPAEPEPRSSNSVPFLLAPVIDMPAAIANRDGGTGAVTITLPVGPEVRPEQQVSLLVGGHEALPAAIASQTDTLVFVFPELAAGTHWLRLRVDGVDSLLINRAETPPEFFTSQQLAIPA